ncbi:MAG: transketolase [Euryarchaeota archaeon]|uniref:Putative transketolase C terminal domain protein n=1 Tax=uncultured archaeon MedDCM-OCT-S04-C14 TaxID=743084 RepID=D6PB30_9ARCH|nr:putative transketolase C terminal domain protein [uncultured archaeon MedDCM-OCT-S04-C14]MAV78255.1 transketolase [Euryarchaeota archaeon]|tara:strand:- start:1678 stop:2616 length:939 start_codon:yes stop_codon:yes gene_type:complete
MTKMGATRDGYGEALLELASNPKVVVLEADLGKSTKSLHFRKAHPERTVSCGIGEQNMLLVGAGLAASGYIPFASTFAIFTERAFEQMRNGVARPNLAVHVCGSHGGTHTGTDGSSAQSIEDLAIYRTLPNVIVMHPSDVVSTKELTIQLAATGSPSYTRTARNKTPVLYEGRENEIKIGKGIVLKQGSDVAIIACGVMVSQSLEAAEALAAEGINATVVDMHTLKPLDGELVDRLVADCGAIVTAEDHNVIGGLGGAVAEHLTANAFAPLERVGVQDRFGESGQADEMLEVMQISAPYIAAAAKKAMARKG